MFEVGTPVLSLQQIPMILLPGKHRRAVREGGDMKAKYHQGAGLGQVEEEERVSREWVGAGSSRNCVWAVQAYHVWVSVAPPSLGTLS